jgi:flagellar biosynthesis protein FlhF
MNIRRFIARDMRDALREIRAALGPDAVMLSSRSTEQGVEVIAAMDYDDRLLAAVGEDDAAAASAPLLAKEPTGPEADPGGAQESPTYEQIARRFRRSNGPTPIPEPQPVAMVPPPPGTGTDVTNELKDLRYLLESQLASLAWNDLNRRRPARARALRQLSKLGVDAALAREIAAQMPSANTRREAWRVPLRMFAERLPLARRDLAEIGGTFAVVGPTGVGKTTNIAKIAARFVLRNRVQGLGLVSTDTYRIGAREQLLTFARILGAPMHVAENARELRSVLDSLADKKLVLIDTAGMSQRDLRLANQFSTLRVTGHRVHPVLAVSAAAERGSLEETLAVFRAVSPKALIITKLDEATSLGPVLSLAIRSALPVAYLSDGQRVPEDIHLAGPKRVWLMQRATQLARDHTGVPDEQELADAFGPMELAVNG